MPPLDLSSAETYKKIIREMSNSKMAAKIEDGGQKFWVPSTRNFSLANIFPHAKIRLVPKCVTDWAISRA